MNKRIKRIFNKIVVTAIILLIQIAWTILLIFRLSEYSQIIESVLRIISVLMVLYIVGKDDNSAYRIGWIILILVIPVFGGLFYLVFGDKKPSKRLRNNIRKSHEKLKKYMPEDLSTIEEFKRIDKRACATSSYIKNISDYPVWKNTSTKYYSVGEEMFKDMLEELEKAKRFIFLEYFIIEEGKMWNAILDILIRKANEGVEVRIIYDDIGCAATLPAKYYRYIEKINENMHCVAFNPFVPMISLVMNNRDHRKIMVIDGETAFTGGINLADEYINENLRFGHWKDTGISIKGDAVWNFTIIFLETWRAYRKDEEDIIKYKTERKPAEDVIDNGFVQPFCDTPLENEAIAENVYIEILNQAERYVYIFTPYLIIDDEMKIALRLAAKRGVDVRIVTPGIPDKKIVYRLTRSNYVPLLKSGIKIYEYTPGFIHAKSYVCDDKFAVVGTINMDYRSLYLHFECGVFMYKTSAIQELKKDCEMVFEKSVEVKKDIKRKHIIEGLFDAILRIFSPLL